MRQLLWAVFLPFAVLLSNISVAEPDAEIGYISKVIQASEGAVPACTPLSAEIKKKKVILTDPNKVWGKVRMSKTAFDALSRYEGFDQCVADVPAYAGRFNQDQLNALTEGQLAATMPIEFALMILGPPTQPPMVLSMVDPITGKPTTTKTYMWIHTFGKMGVLRTVFNLVGGVALGVAGTTSNLDTAVDALSVANAASAAQLITWSVTDFSQSKIVTIQVDADGQITLLMAQ